MGIVNSYFYVSQAGYLDVEILMYPAVPEPRQI